MKRWALLVFLVLGLSVLARAANPPAVGIEGRLVNLLPGTTLLAKAVEKAAPVNLRIASTRPHGTLTEYDLRYIGLVPGGYDLRAFLIRQDGSTIDDLPPLPVKIAGTLPEKHLGELNPRPLAPVRGLGGYRLLLSGVVALWALLAVPLFLLNRRRRPSAQGPAPEGEPGLAERLRPLVSAAIAGALSTDEKAQLERMLLAHWLERLDLRELSPAEAIVRLRAHPEAGELLRALEDWLHRPPGNVRVDLEKVLAPYSSPVTPVFAAHP